MKDTQQQKRRSYLHIYHVISSWIKELGRVFVFATTAAIIISFIDEDGVSILRSLMTLSAGSVMMLVGIGLEHWLLKKKFESINY